MIQINKYRKPIETRLVIEILFRVPSLQYFKENVMGRFWDCNSEPNYQILLYCKPTMPQNTLEVCVSVSFAVKISRFLKFRQHQSQAQEELLPVAEYRQQ